MAIETDVNLKEFPTTRYQGSKRKILTWIYQNIKDLNFETALDGFGGSGSVSYLLKKMDKTVHYNDKLKFNSIIGKALIENNNIKLTEQDVQNLLQSNPIAKNFSLVEDVFKDVYFLEEENKLIDLVTSNIITMNHYDSDTLQYKRAVAYYALFQSSIIKRPFNLFHRKNLNLRTSDVKRNFGNKTTWDKPFPLYIEKFAQEANHFIFDNGKSCLSLNESIFDIDPNGYDLVYLDPPYLSQNTYNNESSDYLRCYHFLEGLSNYEEWKSLIDHSSSNLRLQFIRDMNDFKHGVVKEKIESLIEKFKNSIIVFSYKIGGIPSVEEIENMVKKHKKQVITLSLQYKYALNRQNGNADLNREVLIIGI